MIENRISTCLDDFLEYLIPLGKVVKQRMNCELHRDLSSEEKALIGGLWFSVLDRDR